MGDLKDGDFPIYHMGTTIPLYWLKKREYGIEITDASDKSLVRLSHAGCRFVGKELIKIGKHSDMGV